MIYRSISTCTSIGFLEAIKRGDGLAGQDTEANKYDPKRSDEWIYLSRLEGHGLPAGEVYLCLSKKSQEGVLSESLFIGVYRFLFKDGCPECNEGHRSAHIISLQSKLSIPLPSGAWHPKGIGFFEERKVSDGFDWGRRIVNKVVERHKNRIFKYKRDAMR